MRPATGNHHGSCAWTTALRVCAGSLALLFLPAVSEAHGNILPAVLFVVIGPAIGILLWIYILVKAIDVMIGLHTARYRLLRLLPVAAGAAATLLIIAGAKTDIFAQWWKMPLVYLVAAAVILAGRLQEKQLQKEYGGPAGGTG